MGYGSAGNAPMDALKDRHNKPTAFIVRKRQTSNSATLIENYARVNNIKQYDVKLDMMQTIEASRYKKCNPARTGSEMYVDFRNAIRSCLIQERCHTVVVNMDCDKTPTTVKDLVYYTIGGKRRLNKKVMPIPKGDIKVISDMKGPETDEWTSMKLNRTLRKQINWYFSDRFIREIVLDNRIKGEKIVVLDNCIKEEDLTKDPDETDYYTVCIKYVNGEKVSIDIFPASTIHEGEIGMIYFAMKSKRPQFLITTDFDMIHICLLNEKYLNLDKRQVVIVRNTTTKFSREIMKEIINGLKSNLSDDVIVKKLARFTKNAPSYKNVINEIRKDKKMEKKLEKNIRQIEKNTDPNKITTFINVNQLITNIKRFYLKNGIKENSMEIEVFAMLLGGCDFVKKPFNRCGYMKCINSELFGSLEKYKNIISEMSIQVSDPDHDEKEIFGILPYIDIKVFKTFTENVYKKRSVNTWKKNYDKFLDFDLVSMRQIMYYMFIVMNVPKLCLDHGFSLVPDPCALDEDNNNRLSIWGYKMAKVKGSPFPKVCVSAEKISEIWGSEEQQ